MAPGMTIAAPNRLAECMTARRITRSKGPRDIRSGATHGEGLAGSPLQTKTRFYGSTPDSTITVFLELTFEESLAFKDYGSALALLPGMN